MILDTATINSSLFNNTLGSAHDQLKKAFSEIHEQFEDHLTAINENTNEIQASHQYIAELDTKLEKLNQRLERIELFLQKERGLEIEKKPVFNIKPLTKREKEIFLILYTSEEKKALTYLDIARATALTEDIVSSYITSIMRKGVPLIKKYINSKAFLRLDPVFKALQAKENILKIEQKTLSLA